MLIKTRGIIFRTLKYSETSVIVDIYTEEKGLQSYIINGVRSKNARIKASVLQVMTLVDMVAYHRGDNKLARVKEIKVAYVFQSIPFDIVKGAVGLFMAELARKTIKESEENRPLFRFLFDSFQQLDATEYSVANYHIAFMVHLTTFLGFQPGGHYTEETRIFDLSEGVFSPLEAEGHLSLNEGQGILLDNFMHTAVAQCHILRLNRQERKAFLEKLLTFYQLHVESFDTLNAHKILEEVLGA